MTNKKIRILFVIIFILQLFYLFQYRSGFQYEIIKNPFKKNAGISFVVSPAIIESNHILKKFNAEDFNLSEIIKNNSYLYQRSIEFNYPIRLKENSKMFFFLIKENIPEGCEILETGRYLKFAKC